MLNRGTYAYFSQTLGKYTRKVPYYRDYSGHTKIIAEKEVLHLFYTCGRSSTSVGFFPRKGAKHSTQVSGFDAFVHCFNRNNKDVVTDSMLFKT